jgi:hypothetical protein
MPPLTRVVLQAVFSLHRLLRGNGNKTNQHSYHRTRGFALIATDISYDVHMNAQILDVNSGPSATPPFFDGRQHPRWLLTERSRLIREAKDIVQEVRL